MTEEMIQHTQPKNKDEIIYEAGGQTIKLSPSIINQFISKGNANINIEEAVNFMQLCKYSELNPFLNEAYLIKYSNDRPAEMVVSKEALMKRASRHPQYNGYEAGVIVEDAEGDIKNKKGQFVSSKEKLVGGWASVYRKDIDRPFDIEVNLDEYNTFKSTWKKMPGNMIRKVALVNALRETFPEQLGAMYTEDEPNPTEVKEAVKTEELDEVTNELLQDFKPEEEQTDNEILEETPYVPFEEVENESTKIERDPRDGDNQEQLLF